MKRSEKRKLYLLFSVTMLLVAVVWMLLAHMEEDIPVTKLEADDKHFLADKPVEEEKKVQGTLKLAGEKYDYYHEMKSYLFIGTDASGNITEDNREKEKKEASQKEEEASGEEYQGSMADFLLLAVFDCTEESYGFLLLDRDTIAEVRLLEKDNTGIATAEIQLCTACWYGGDVQASCGNVTEAVSGLLGGLEIDGYYSLNMKSIEEINHLVGGVEVTLEEDIPEGGSEMRKGNRLTLTDKQAYHYLHDRYGVGDETNISRMKRQKQYLKGFLDKLKSSAETDKAFPLRLFQKLEHKAVSSISGKDISRMAKFLQGGESKGIKEFSGTSEIGQALDDGIDHSEFYIDSDSLVEIMTELYGLEKR